MALVCTAPTLFARSTLLRQQQRRCTAGSFVVRAGPGPAMRSFDLPPTSSNGSVPLSRAGSGAAATTSDAAAVAAAVAAGEPAVRSFRVSPWVAMRFNGPVPERVNGRLAMLAFMYIAQQEMETGQTVFQQVLQLPTHYAAWPLVALMLVMVYAAFPPALAGAREENFGFFTVAAEKTNGRAAMLGLAVLAALEWNSGYCFF